MEKALPHVKRGYSLPAVWPRAYHRRMDQAEDRAERLASALRDNLRRRKAQARERDTSTATPADAESSTPPITAAP